MKKFDAIVIGAGQAGLPMAGKLARAGKKTLLVEKRRLGGTCINDGCTPTKTLIASARMAHLARNSAALGIEIPGLKVDYETVRARAIAISDRFRASATENAEGTKGLRICYGAAVFLENKVIEVQHAAGRAERFTAPIIVINTGASPLIPDIPGIRGVNYLTSETVLDLQEIPRHLIIAGGGYIGLEYAQLFRRFGAGVTLIEQADRLLPHEDADACAVISEVFQKEGIAVMTGAKVTGFHPYGKSRVQLTLEGERSESRVTGSHVLLAFGRTPQTEGLGLENTGIRRDEEGHVLVDEFLETNVPGVFALGDVKGGPAFTHIAYNDHYLLSRRLLNGKKQSVKERLLSYCMFTDPQMGRVGVTENEAIQAGLDYACAKLPMRNVARAIETGETQGFMKAIVDRKSKKILGASIIGEAGGEIMSILQMAMMGGLTWEQVRYATFAHPLYAESLNNLFMSLKE
ncbi:FAD-containing oxidoreductase [Pedobacter yulinensis]|uniref:FAD-containing oxidoreductase n=1 Tax=Pedobacter yulinensis TaxID=2126353 RepID=A0A2T3HIA0_9SPHI|nr:mercuric reductase [Pedobacter yulinensis]PST82174.1 FAD-containing oxidoreductase [Pedobacter yulinensis]